MKMSGYLHALATSEEKDSVAHLIADRRVGTRDTLDTVQNSYISSPLPWIEQFFVI
jgi:hypothetical protein